MFRFAFAESELYNSGEKHVEGVVPGWFMGRKIDLSDSQWNMLRSHFPVLIGGMSLFLFLSDIVKRSGSVSQRILFYNAMSLVLIFILHGVSAFWLLVISVLNCILRGHRSTFFVLSDNTLIINRFNNSRLEQLSLPAIRSVGLQLDHLVDILLLSWIPIRWHVWCQLRVARWT